MDVRYMDTVCTIFTNTKFTGSLLCAFSVAKLCPTVCYPMECSLPSCSVPGISQA